MKTFTEIETCVDAIAEAKEGRDLEEAYLWIIGELLDPRRKEVAYTPAVRDETGRIIEPGRCVG